MGCGCRERAARYGKRLEEKGMARAAAVVRKLPDVTDRIKDAAVEAARPRRTKIRGGQRSGSQGDRG